MNLLTNGEFEGSESPWLVTEGIWSASGGYIGPGCVVLDCTGGFLSLGIPPITSVLTQYGLAVVPGTRITTTLWAKTLPVSVLITGYYIEDGVAVSIGNNTCPRTDYGQLTFGSYTPTIHTVDLVFIVQIFGDGRTATVYVDDVASYTVTPMGVIQYYPPQNGKLRPTFQSWDIDDILGTLVRRDRVRLDEDSLIRDVRDLGKRDRDNTLKNLDWPTERSFEEL